MYNINILYNIFNDVSQSADGMGVLGEAVRAKMLVVSSSDASAPPACLSPASRKRASSAH
jgi:hypothetical protein